MLQDAPSSIKLARGHLNSFIAVKSGYPFAIDDGIKISLPEIITYKHVLLVGAYIGSSIIQLQDGWVTFGGTTEIFSTKTGGEVQEQEKPKLLYCHWTHISRFLAAWCIFLFYFSFPFLMLDGARLRQYQLKFRDVIHDCFRSQL